MKMLNFIIVFVLLAQAASGASLADLQQLALDNRHVIERARLSLEQSRQSEEIARGAYYPSVDLSFTHTRLDESSAVEGLQRSTAGATLTWNLFAGFRDKYNLRSAGLLRSAEAYRLQGIQQDIQLAVALRYLSIFDRQANLQVEQDFFSTLSKVYQDAENRFNVGLLKKNDLLKFKVDLDNAVITQEKAASELAKAVHLLQREVEADVQLEQLSFDEFKQLPSVADHEKYEAEMLQNRSEIKVFEELALAATAQVLAEKSRYYPRVDLTSSYRRYDDDLVGGGPADDDEFRTQLLLSMNIFDGFGKKYRLSRAKLETQAIDHDLEELKSDLKTVLKNLFLDYEVAAENVEVAGSSIRQAEENERVTRLSYQEGLATESDLLDAIAKLSRARYNHVAATSEVFANFFNITRAVEGFAKNPVRRKTGGD